MHHIAKISLIEPDIQRRVQCFEMLKNDRFHVNAFENAKEYQSLGKTDSLVLMSDEDGGLAALLRDMRDGDCWAPTVGYGAPLNPIRCSQLFLSGMTGYLAVPFNLGDLTALLEGAFEHISAQIDLHHGVADARQKILMLTKREAEVLERLQVGMTNLEIGDNLGISGRTVEIHRAKLLRKLGSITTAEAVRIGMHANLRL